MPNKGSDKGQKKHDSGVRRIPAKAHTKQSIPTTGSKSESGPRRLYAHANSARSTSTLESGPRRLYMSAGVQGQRAVVRGAVKPA